MVSSERPGEDVERPTQEFARFVRATARSVQEAEVVEGDGDVGMAAPENPFLDRESPAIESVGLPYLIALRLHGGEVVQIHGDLIVDRPIGSPKEGNGPTEHRLGLVQVPLVLEEGGQRR